MAGRPSSARASIPSYFGTKDQCLIVELRPPARTWLRYAYATKALRRRARIHLVQATFGYASVATTGCTVRARLNDSLARYASGRWKQRYSNDITRDRTILETYRVEIDAGLCAEDDAYSNRVWRGAKLVPPILIDEGICRIRRVRPCVRTLLVASPSTRRAARRP